MHLSIPLDELEVAQVGGALVAVRQGMVAHQVRTEDGGLWKSLSWRRCSIWAAMAERTVCAIGTPSV